MEDHQDHYYCGYYHFYNSFFFDYVEIIPGADIFMSHKSKKTYARKIRVVDYEACWKDYLSMVYQEILRREHVGSVRNLKQLELHLKTLREIEKDHTRYEISK